MVRTGGSPYVVADEAHMGRYVYANDAISPQCGKVTLQVFSTKDPEHPLERVLDEKVVTRLWQDFEPYRKLRAQQKSVAAPQWWVATLGALPRRGEWVFQVFKNPRLNRSRI